MALAELPREPLRDCGVQRGELAGAADGCRDGRFDVKTATTGYDAGLLTESFKPHLIILDFMLPDITGDDVLAAIQSHRDRRMKMVVYSVHTRDAIKQHPNLEARLMELGADEFLSKSAGMRALIELGIARGEIQHKNLARFPQIMVAPALIAVIWQSLFSRHAPLDALEMFRVHLDLIFGERRAT